VYVADKDIHHLVNKYDKDRDGKISFNEFFDEISPKKAY